MMQEADKRPRILIVDDEDARGRCDTRHRRAYRFVADSALSAFV